MRWGAAFEEARRRLMDCDDFARLLSAGHELRDGAALTSMSATPFEISFKCIRCARTFWFENPSWRTRDKADWQFNRETRDEVGSACIPMQPASARAQLNRRNGIMHP